MNAKHTHAWTRYVTRSPGWTVDGWYAYDECYDCGARSTSPTPAMLSEKLTYVVDNMGTS